jgi:hypothetical protein
VVCLDQIAFLLQGSRRIDFLGGLPTDQVLVHILQAMKVLQIHIKIHQLVGKYSKTSCKIIVDKLKFSFLYILFEEVAE